MTETATPTTAGAMSTQGLADLIEQLLGFDVTEQRIDEVNGGFPDEVDVIDEDGNEFTVTVTRKPS